MVSSAERKSNQNYEKTEHAKMVRREYALKNKEYIKARRQEYNQTNKEQNRDYQRAYRKKQKENNRMFRRKTTRKTPTKKLVRATSPSARQVIIPIITIRAEHSFATQIKIEKIFYLL